MSNMITKNPTTTSKKIKYMHSEIWTDEKGQPVEMQVSNVEERDFNFNKIFMKEFLFSLNKLGNKKLQVATYIMENADGNNIFNGRIQDIMKDTGFGKNTVIETIKILKEANFLRRKHAGMYVINPNIIVKGTHSHRLNICRKYNDINAPEITREEEIANIDKAMKKLQDRRNKLTLTQEQE